MKSIGRKLTAGLLALSMLGSFILPSNVFAAEASGEDASASTTDQIVYGQYDKDGNWAEGEPSATLPDGVKSINKTC